MTVKTILQLSLVLLSAIALIFFASLLMCESVASLARNSLYLSAPVIINEDDFAGHDDHIVWLYGRLAPRDGEPAMYSPLSETNCLYFRYEKRQGSWETDSDGDRYRVWTVIEEKTKAVTSVLLTGGRKTVLADNGAVYYNLYTAADFEKTENGIDYNFREFIVPIENKTWVLGKLSDNEIGKTDREFFVSLSSQDSLIHFFKDTSVVFLCFSILCFIAGTGCLSFFIVTLLRKRKIFLRPVDVAMAFLTLGLFWVLTCLMFVSFYQKTLCDSILTGIIVFLSIIGFIVPPLAVVACRASAGPFFVFFPPAFGLVVLGSRFFYLSLFTLTVRLLPLFAGVLCLALAVGLVQIYRLFFAREE